MKESWYVSPVLFNNCIIRFKRHNFSAKTAVACFIITQVDRCNSLLACAPKFLLDRLQSALNSAARLVCNHRKFDHVKPLLSDLLHWLQVQYRIDYKLALLVYKSNGAAAEY